MVNRSMTTSRSAVLLLRLDFRRWRALGTFTSVLGRCEAQFTAIFAARIPVDRNESQISAAAGYWLANSKLPSGSASNSEPTSRASTRSAVLHLFQSPIQSVFHLMLGEKGACRVCPLDNSGQRLDNDCRPPALAASPSMSGIVRHPISVDARFYARDASQYWGNRQRVREDAHMTQGRVRKGLQLLGITTDAIFAGDIAGASSKYASILKRLQEPARIEYRGKRGLEIGAT